MADNSYYTSVLNARQPATNNKTHHNLASKNQNIDTNENCAETTNKLIHTTQNKNMRNTSLNAIRKNKSQLKSRQSSTLPKIHSSCRLQDNSAGKAVGSPLPLLRPSSTYQGASSIQRFMPHSSEITSKSSPVAEVNTCSEELDPLTNITPISCSETASGVLSDAATIIGDTSSSDDDYDQSGYDGNLTNDNVIIINNDYQSNDNNNNNSSELQNRYMDQNENYNKQVSNHVTNSALINSIQNSSNGWVGCSQDFVTRLSALEERMTLLESLANRWTEEQPTLHHRGRPSENKYSNSKNSTCESGVKLRHFKYDDTNLPQYSSRHDFQPFDELDGSTQQVIHTKTKKNDMDLEQELQLSGLHGISSLFSATNPCHRLMWATLLICLFIMTLAHTTVTIFNATQSPTHFKISYKPTNKLTFPDLTICSHEGMFLNITLLENNLVKHRAVTVANSVKTSQNITHEGNKKSSKTTESFDENGIIEIDLEQMLGVMSAMPDLGYFKATLLRHSKYTINDLDLETGLQRLSHVFHGDLVAAVRYILQYYSMACDAVFKGCYHDDEVFDCCSIMRRVFNVFYGYCYVTNMDLIHNSSDAEDSSARHTQDHFLWLEITPEYYYSPYEKKSIPPGNIPSASLAISTVTIDQNNINNENSENNKNDEQTIVNNNENGDTSGSSTKTDNPPQEETTTSDDQDAQMLGLSGTLGIQLGHEQWYSIVHAMLPRTRNELSFQFRHVIDMEQKWQCKSKKQSHSAWFDEYSVSGCIAEDWLKALARFWEDKCTWPLFGLLHNQEGLQEVTRLPKTHRRNKRHTNTPTSPDHDTIYSKIRRNEQPLKRRILPIHAIYPENIEMNKETDEEFEIKIENINEKSNKRNTKTRRAIALAELEHSQRLGNDKISPFIPNDSKATHSLSQAFRNVNLHGSRPRRASRFTVNKGADAENPKPSSIQEKAKIIETSTKTSFCHNVNGNLVAGEASWRIGQVDKWNASHCLPLCERKEYSLANRQEVRGYVGDSIILHIFYTNPSYTILQEVPTLKWTDYLSLVGGLMGLWLGSSIITVIHIVGVVTVVLVDQFKKFLARLGWAEEKSPNNKHKTRVTMKQTTIPAQNSNGAVTLIQTL